MSDTVSRWKDWARSFKREAKVMYLALRDPRTPWYAKVTGGCVLAYLVSPLDLIPDFIPILGVVDDLILVPLGLWLTRRMIPPEVLVECRAKADDERIARGWVGYAIAAVIVAMWVAAAAALVWGIVHYVRRPHGGT